jgi:hypothetical protein
MDRVARTLTSDEKEERNAVRASWIDASQVEVFPTLDDETRERRAMRQRAIAYADARRERQQTASRHVATGKARDAYHRLREGGIV